MNFLHAGLIVFAIALSVSTPAQTTICSGDSVVLVLDGYKQGSTLWEQSTDQTTWSDAQGVSYNDSLVITAINTFYYRAKVTDGTCDPFYSDTVLVTVRPVPSPLTANPASNVTLLSFDANWTASGSSTTYNLDVASDPGFTSFVVGYNNLKVESYTTYRVTGVYCSTTYYYRVRVYDDTCDTTSNNSNSITVPTLDCPVYCTYKSVCSGDITDTRDNQIYKTVQIGSQCWMAQNLNVGKMIQGAILQTQQDADIEKYCHGNDVENCTRYGGLYLWNEMMSYGLSQTDAPSIQGICPVGWHVPTDNEWKCLEMNVGMSETDADISGPRGTAEGNKLKTKGNGAPPLWASPSAGNDTSGFSARPGGIRSNNGMFSAVSTNGYFWSATEDGAAYAWYRLLNNNSPQVNRGTGSIKSIVGLSVRCVKN